MSNLKERVKEALLTFEPEKLVELTEKSLEEGRGAIELIDAISSSLQEVGRKFEEGELFLAHLVAAGEAAKKVISERLEPLLKKTQAKREFVGHVVIGTVAGDIHDIGKSIVASLLFSAGFNVIDLGYDVPVEEYVKAVKKSRPDIVAMSALLSTTLPVQKEVIDALKANNLRDGVRVMVGGAPVTAEWAEEIGADGYGEDAVEAVKVALRLRGRGG